MKITFIGTGSGKATLNRNHSSLLFASGKYNLLVDAGDGISRALIGNGINFNYINGILFTHLHPDHFSGLPALIVQMKMINRTEPLVVYIHDSLRNVVEEFLVRSYLLPERMGFEIVYKTFRDNERFVISENFSFVARKNSHLSNLEKFKTKYSSLSLYSASFLAGRGAVQANIFPIPPQGERRIELEYTQALAAENGLVRYVYPLSTEKYSAWPLESVSIDVDLRSSQPIRAVYSPSHTVAISRENPNHVRVGYEAKDVLPDSDFALYYSTGENEAIHLLSYRQPDDSDPDGFFLLLLAPSPEVSTEALPKDILLVLDRSGSMEGEKFRQAQECADLCPGAPKPGRPL